jgi:aspartyl-tRNA(Asn)/glutamyl-tRNA(Gln) amidotransferase subunit B
VNVSIRFDENGTTHWPPQSEIKNLNSFRALEEAVPYESARLWDEWASGGPLRTRIGKITVGWSAEKRRTYLQRSKEEVDDYRYFPEPDLTVLTPDRAMVERIRAGLPEMPSDRRRRFVTQYGLSDYDARVLVSDRELADAFEKTATLTREPKRIANFLTTDLLGYLNTREKKLSDIRFDPTQLASLVGFVVDGTVSSSTAREVFVASLESGKDPKAIIDERGLKQVSDESAIAAAVDAAIAANPKAVADIRAGNQRAVAALFGPVMKELGGKANPTVVNRLIAERVK